jgi:predicted homoserine dehydrogenase-like protein
MGAIKRMNQFAQDGNVVRVAILGAGYVGRCLVDQLGRSPGMRPAIVVNRTPANAVKAYEAAGVDAGGVVVSEDRDELATAIAEERAAVTTRPEVLTELPVDLVIAATGAMDYGASAMLHILEAGTDVISMNAEVDATLGALLHHTARVNGALYTIADGDQPGAMLRQLEFVEGMGLEILAAVNCKRHMDLHQNPDDSRPFAERDNTSVHMTTAFGDGTKMQIENAVVANVTGLVPDRRGMHGVRTTVDQARDDIPAALSRTGCVEYTLGGDFAAGIGVVGRSPGSPVLGSALKLYKMGDGPDYFFFRPYHLVALEVPKTVAEVVLDRQALGRHPAQQITEVVAMAKRGLRPGDALDGIGGHTCYGLVDTAERASGLLPIGLSGGARVIKPVGQDGPVPLDAVELNEDSAVVRLRRQQERLP